MDIQVLVATMFQENEHLAKQMHITSDYVIINQTNYNNNKVISFHDSNNKKIYISTEERGLSKSRNMAISNATAEICLIADDDLIYYDGYEESITNAYKKYPDADLILFDFDEPNGIRKRKSVAKKSGKLNYLQLLRGNSVRISFKLESIKKKGIKFNEYFGAGSKCFTASEDTLFLVSCYKAGLKIYYVDYKILKLKDSTRSTWFNGFNHQYFYTIGAFAYEYASFLWPVYIIQFVLRHRKQCREEGSIKAIKNMILGKRKYEELLKSRK